MQGRMGIGEGDLSKGTSQTMETWKIVEEGDK